MSSPPPPDLVCVGHVVREMIRRARADGPDSLEGPFLGSPPAYCSVAAARQGTRTGVVSVIGADMPPALLDPLRQAGVDTAGLLHGDRTTASELVYDLHGHKEIRYPAKARPIRPDDIPAAYRGCGIVYVCTMDNDVLLADLTEVAACGQNSAVDLGGYGGVHMSVAHRKAVASLPDLACEAASSFTIVKASDEDVRAIFGERDHERAADTLLACGPSIVLITLGGAGVYVRTAAGHWLVPAAPSRVVDTTGGGDSFMAGFLSEYLRSADPLRAARWGSATAACVIEQSGGVHIGRMPTREIVLDRLATAYGAS